MNKMRNWIVGLTVVALLAVGVVALAGNGFGGGNPASQGPSPVATSGSLCDRDDDGDGIPNSEDSDWVCPMDGSGYGEGKGYGQSLSEDRPLNGTGFGARRGGGMGHGHGAGSCS